VVLERQGDFHRYVQAIFVKKKLLGATKTVAASCLNLVSLWFSDKLQVLNNYFLDCEIGLLVDNVAELLEESDGVLYNTAAEMAMGIFPELPKWRPNLLCKQDRLVTILRNPSIVQSTRTQSVASEVAIAVKLGTKLLLKEMHEFEKENNITEKTLKPEDAEKLNDFTQEIVDISTQFPVFILNMRN